ncbi:Radical SAM domain protein [Acidisarcina polymorpha]|uniref:Radical SAM domain protein n=1 Tax=Acidisarcina polymorpha TaxID=2211140 RepID=A0A2Z5G6W5_9BACT|nr:radical SAM protein [Acidisarcina polymorpha]AXC14729.1 Radical SAM domain protein [Acidisarcina polymorpha]
MANTLIASPSLFPILDQPAADCRLSPKGIARLAASSSKVDHGHEVEFRSLKVRSILNNSVSRRRLSFSKSINPYRGCEFACRYCYARYTHEYMELRQPEDFEQKIFVKQNAAWLLQQELRQLRGGEEIAIGTATDPYQPVERKAKVTRSLLEVFAQRRRLRIGIVTKSTLITRDIDLFERIAEHNELVIHLTITTPDAKLARILEPRAPRPDLRLRTVARLRQAGLRTGILCSPLLPGITDSLEAIDSMASRAKDAGASFFAAQPLFLKPCSRETYLAFVRKHFPALESLYRFRFDGRDFVADAYRKRMEALVDEVTRKHGLASRSSDALLTRDVGREPPSSPCGQTTLWVEKKPPLRTTTPFSVRSSGPNGGSSTS